MDVIDETNRFFDHNAAGVDAVAASLVSAGQEPHSFVVLVIDASKGKGKTLVEIIERQKGSSYEERFRDLPKDQDATLVTSMGRQDAAKMVAGWNAGSARMLEAPPATGSYWVVIIAAGVTRVLDREPPKHVGQA